MKCPIYEKLIALDWLEFECIEPNEEFNCPHCNEVLRYEIDEGTYLGAQQPIHSECQVDSLTLQLWV